MSIPDYHQRAEDHRTVVVLVKPIGKISQKSFDKVFRNIKYIQYLKIRDAGGSRKMWIRYEFDYPEENNNWGDFQAHRKILGFISIGKGDSEENVEELCKLHSDALKCYSDSVFDSRCFVFGQEELSPSSDNHEKISLSSEDMVISPDSMHSSGIDTLQNDVFKDEVEPVPKSHLTSEDEINLYNYSSSPKSDSSEYGSKNTNEDSDSPTEFSSLKTSEVKLSDASERLNFSFSLSSPGPEGTSESPNPSSKKFLIPSGSSSNSTHCICYPGIENCENLESDVKEFLNSIFWILESKRLDRSFEKLDKVPLLTAPFEKKSFVGIDTETKVYKKRCLGRMKKHIGDLALQAGLPLEAFSMYFSSVEFLKSSQDWLWLAAAYEGQCAASIVIQSQFKVLPLEQIEHSKSRVSKLIKTGASQSKSLPLSLDSAEYKNLGKTMLSADEIIEKYDESIAHYQKYQAAVIVELECSIKAARVFTSYRRYLEANKVLQNVIFTAILQTDEEKLIRFNAIADVYMGMGFKRKAAFFKRIAAMRCVSATNPSPDWKKCYSLMLESLPGFSLPLDVEKFPTGTTLGWPGIQLQMLYDIFSVSKMMNNQAVTVRHMSFILHTLLNHLSSEEQQNICQQLEILTTKCEGAPVPLILDDGTILPPVNLLNLPRVKSFKLQNLAPHLRPVKMKVNGLRADCDHDSIFIFSPISRERAPKDKIDFKWVEGDVCEVALQVFNPLPFELKVTHMGLLADDVPFESFPACLSLPAESGPYPVTLLGSPLGSGKLQILGYTTHVLGVKSTCRLKDISFIKKPHFNIDVIPRLPCIQLSTSLPKASMFSSLEDTSYVVISASATMYSGESQECTVTISNTGTEAVEWVDISINSKMKKDMESSFFSWSKENLLSQLPIASGSAASFTLYLNAIGDFMNLLPRGVIEDGLNRSGASSLTDTPLKKKVQVSHSPDQYTAKTVEAVLQIQYSGGPGMEAGYCRQSAIALTIEVLPSILITKWDVLPSEIPTHCYLVFDIMNATSYEMEVQYASNKQILIEAHDICRVPVPVERCPLSAMTDSFGIVWASIDICGHLWKYLDDDRDKRKAKLLTACRRHLESLVNLQWTLSALEINGKASISEITWTDHMLGFILMSPLQFDVHINGRVYKPEFEFSFPIGEEVTFSIKLLNVSDVPVLNLNLFVRGYQDYQNGKHSYRIETKRAVCGRDRLCIDKIKPHEEFSHECSFIFFHSGMFKVDILCSHNDPMMLQTPALLELDTDSIACIRGKKTQSIYTQSPCLIQKCSPTVDISIFED